MQRTSRCRRHTLTRLGSSWGLVGVALAILTTTGCGGGSDSPAAPTSTPTRTRTVPPSTATATLTRSVAPQSPTRTTTPTATSQPSTTQNPNVTPSATATTSSPANAVSGLIVLQRDLQSAPAEVGVPPSDWAAPADREIFDKALSHADWSTSGKGGATKADGSFEISDLPPGRYVLDIRKTLSGNLLPLNIPFVVGDEGPSGILVEVAQGMARTELTYQKEGADYREVHGPYGNRAVFRAGQLVELSANGRTLVDADGDGQFDGGTCPSPGLYSCPDDRRCSFEPLDERFCQCVSSCQFCDNCESPGVCVSTGTPPPYRCTEDGQCGAGDRCACIPSCPDCKDCAQKLCVPSCDPTSITGITIDGASEVVVGRDTFLRATAELSDGSNIDVTALVSWTSSDPTVASVSSWGQVTARALGTTSLGASLGNAQSVAFPLTVVARPTLTTIEIRNLACSCGGPLYYDAVRGLPVPCYLARPTADALAFLPPGDCRQTVLVGGTIQFTAIGQFADGTVDDITKEVSWYIEPAQVGSIETGLFTAREAGSARILASVGNLLSAPTDVKVVSEASVESLSIYPSNWGYAAVTGGPVSDAAATSPCYNCGASVSLLRGDQLHFQATARYDTGEWRDVTTSVTWRTNNDSVATIGSDGVMSSLQAGLVTIDATLADTSSNSVTVSVVNQATLTSLSIYQEGTDRVLAKGDQRFFHASGFYDVGFSRDVTKDAEWISSNPAIGSFDSKGVFSGKQAGFVNVWAQVGDQVSNQLTLEVFETSELSYCDPSNVNRNVWADDFNRVVLESDCGTYAPASLVTLRYSVSETTPHGGIFDPCLDLYVYQGGERIRTIREEGCGEPFLPSGAPGRDEAALKYQLRAFWDMKDNAGRPVGPGRYEIYGRFYLYYDPVVRIDVIVTGDGGLIPCTVDTCGNGCGYVHACGDDHVPLICPTVCQTLCECPPGWGITSSGQCEACTGECCPEGAACAPGVVRCEPKPTCCPVGQICEDPDLPACAPACCPDDPAVTCLTGTPVCPKPCCNPGEVCPDDRPACELKCCPAGSKCDPMALPPCDCCPVGAQCVRDAPPCPVACCPAGAACIPELPPCQPEPELTPTPRAVCTPPLCAPGDVYACTGDCYGGCGTICATPTPNLPQHKGACYIGASHCDSANNFGTIQERCCDLYRFGTGPAAISWCPGDAIDAQGQCQACADNPCEGLIVGTPPPTPPLDATPTPTPATDPSTGQAG